MAKGDKWGQPITEEALIRQGNEKCYQYRRKNRRFPYTELQYIYV